MQFAPFLVGVAGCNVAFGLDEVTEIDDAPTCFRETFVGPDLGARWRELEPGSPMKVSVDDGLVVTLVPGVMAFNGAITTTPLDLSGGSFSVEVSTANVDGFVETDISWQANGDPNNSFYISMGAKQLGLGRYVDGVREWGPTDIAYDPETDRFWRLSHVSDLGLMVYQTSVDGEHWDVRRTVVTDLDMSATSIQLYAGAFQVGSSEPGAARYTLATARAPSCR